MEVSGGLVALLVFKTSVGLNKVPGGFDSHSPPSGIKRRPGEAAALRVRHRTRRRTGDAEAHFCHPYLVPLTEKPNEPVLSFNAGSAAAARSAQMALPL